MALVHLRTAFLLGALLIASVVGAADTQGVTHLFVTGNSDVASSA